MQKQSVCWDSPGPRNKLRLRAAPSMELQLFWTSRVANGGDCGRSEQAAPSLCALMVTLGGAALAALHMPLMSVTGQSL